VSSTGSPISYYLCPAPVRARLLRCWVGGAPCTGCRACRAMTQEVPARAVFDAPNRCRDREQIVEKIVYRDRETPALAKPPAASVPKLPAPTTAGALVPAREAPVPRMVGLGLALERVSGDPTTYVQEIIPGFAAHRSAQFELHDILLSIDNEPVPPPPQMRRTRGSALTGTRRGQVDGWDLDSIKQLTVGAEGTSCTLSMLRGDRYFSVTLTRLAPPAQHQLAKVHANHIKAAPAQAAAPQPQASFVCSAT
jgi:hypothetical protein